MRIEGFAFADPHPYPPHKGEGFANVEASLPLVGRVRVGVLQMPTGISKSAIGNARNFRRNMTAGERRLWSELRDFRRLYGIHVRKQAPIGPYIADFAIHEHGLVIEIDGEHHFTPEGLRRDRVRDEWLASQGYRVLRFNTGELSGSFDGCIVEILDALGLMRVQHPHL